MARNSKPSILDDLWNSLAGGVTGAAAGVAQGGAQVQEELERGANAIGKLAGRKAPVADNNAATLRSIAQGLAESADAQRAEISAGGREAMAKSMPRGNLLEGELDLGEDPSLQGYALNITQGLGSLAPATAAAIATRGRGVGTQAAVGGAAGALTGGGFAAQEEGQRIRAMDPAAFSAAFPGQDQETVARSAERGAFAATAPVSALGGAATSALVGKPAQALLARSVGAGTAARVGTTAAVGGIEEGLQEVGEGLAQRAGATAATGETGRELGEESAANLVLGAAAGGPVAGGIAAATPPPPSVIQPQRGVISRAAARGVETGAVQNATVEFLGSAGDGGFLPDVPMVPDLSPGTELVTQAQGPRAVTKSLIDRGDAGFVVPTNYARGALPREEGEPIKDYAKRAIDQLPPPRAEHLPQDPWAYFNVNKADQLVPLDSLLPGKGKQDRSGENALRRLAAAADGVLDRRDPLDVQVNEDGTYTVLDGNGTLAAAKLAGFAALPVRIKAAPQGKEPWRIDRGYLQPEQSQALTREFEVAVAADPAFKSTIDDIAAAFGARTEHADIKGRNRAEQKAFIDYNGDVTKVNDLLRATIEVDSLDQAEQVLAETSSRLEIVKNKNVLDPALESPYTGGYRDAKLIVRTQEGARAELQVNLKPMLEAKHKAHKLYDQWRRIDAKVREQPGGVPTPAQRAEMARLENEQRAIYEPAWEAVINSRNVASSTGMPLRRTESRKNGLGSAVSNASTAPVSPFSATGTPSTSKNREPGGNLLGTDTLNPPSGIQQDGSTDGTAGAEFLGNYGTRDKRIQRNLRTTRLIQMAQDADPYAAQGRPAETPEPDVDDDADTEVETLDRREGASNLPAKRTKVPANGFGVIVATKPGTKVTVDGELKPYDRNVDAGNLPPAAPSVAREPDLAALQERVSAIFRRPATAAMLKKAFGVGKLNLQTIRGSYEGVPELSFHLTGVGVDDKTAARLAQFLGMAFAQDAVIVTKPDPVGPSDDSIVTLEMYNTDGTKLSDDVFDAATAALRAQGIDYSEARDGRAIRVLHFGDESDLRALADRMVAIATAQGMGINHLHTRSDLYEAQDYRRNLGEGGGDAVPGFGPEVLRGLIDHLLVPYTQAIASVGYQFDAKRFGARYGLEKDEVAYLENALAAARQTRSTVPLLSGEEAVPARDGRGSNRDAAYFLSTRAAAFGNIKPNDRSAATKELIAETLAQEVEYQISKPEGKSAIGWYDRQLKKALATMAKVFPEIESNREHSIVFRSVLATTSQGLDVVMNFNVASKLYARWLETGKIDPGVISLPGRAGTIVRGNLAKLQALIEERGILGAGDFLSAMHTVSDLKKKYGYTETSGLLTDKVRGWFVLGPKIGSFGNNLDGDFDSLTADLWFSRTWNRVLGNMFNYSAKLEAKQIRAFRKELVDAINAGGNKVLDALTESERARIGELEFDFSLAERLYRDFSKGFKDKSPINYAAKGWVLNVKGLTDTPRGDPERRWQTEIMRTVQDKIEARTGQRVAIADMQALLWYQEKELFRLLGAANARSAPLDYADAAELVAKSLTTQALNRKADDATIIDLAYPMGGDYMIKRIGKIVGDARVVVTAGKPNAAFRFAIDRQITADEKLQLIKIGGVKRVAPGVMPTIGKIEAGIDDSSTPPLFQVPASVAMHQHYRALDSSEQEKLKAALAGLKDRGFPAAWLKLPTFVFGHTSDQMFTARFYMTGETKGAVSVRLDSFGKPLSNLIGDLAHELAHAADFNPNTGGFRSLTSPRFKLSVDEVGDINVEGDVIRELVAAWVGTSPIADALNYPFADPDMPADIVAAEAFAQSVMLYVTHNADLKKHAPLTHAMVKEIFSDQNQPNGPSGGRGNDAIQKALRAVGSRKVSARNVQRSADRRGGEGNRGERDSAGAEGRADRSGAVSRLVMRIGGEEPSGVANSNATNLQGMAALLAEIDQSDGAISQIDRPGATLHVYELDVPATEPGEYRYVRKGADNGRDALPDDHFGAKDFGKDGGRWYSFGGKTKAKPVFSIPLDELRKARKASGRDGLFGESGNTDAQFLSEFFAEKLGREDYLNNEEPVKLAARKSSKSARKVTGLNSMPVASFDGYTIPSWEMEDHLRNAATQRMDAYRSAAAGVGDKLRTLFQDYFLPVRRVQEAIVATGQTIGEDEDVYGREETYYGRTGEQLRQLEESHVKPLVKAMVTAGVKQEELELYLYAKFAPKRNERIASINPRFPDGGSGMTNADAAQVLADFQSAGLTPKLEALAARVRKLNAVRIDTLEQAGLLSEGEAELWRSEPDYVPLKGFADVAGKEGATRQPTGQGFSIGGREAHMALGRKSRATDILANAIAQTEQAIIRAEKNRVATALLRLAQANPNEALWEVDTVPEQPVLSPSGEVTYRKNNLHRLADNVVSVKVDGVQHFVTLHDERLAAAMKNLGAAKMGAFLRAFSSFNRFLSLTRTMLAPEFVLANFSRDLQTAAINLTGDQSAAMAGRVVADVPKALRAMYAFNRGKDPGGEWSRWAKEFTAAGGMTSFVGQQTVEEQQAKIEGLLKEAKGGTRAAIRSLVRGTFEFIEDVNGAVENASRLSAYANARRNGQSAQAAARLAKNLTVNFNRKGMAGPTINALYLFYNASIQGSARFLRAMKSPKVQKIMAATAVMGFALAHMNRVVGGEDDDGEDRWDKIPEWEKARNLIILLPAGKTIKIPMPYTYNLPFLMGSEMEAMINSKRPASSAAANLAEALLTSFNPIGDVDLKGDSSVAAAKLLAPSAVDPLVDIAVNRNFFGAPIAPERNPFDKTPDPDSQRYFASTNPGAVWLADQLNSATGGDKLRSGLIDVSPASMVYVFDYLTGGTGGFVERSATAVMLAAKGEPVPMRTIPFARVFAGELSERRVTDTFYRLREDVNLKAEMAKLGTYDSEGERKEALLGRRMAPRLRAAERQLSTLRALRKKALAAGNDARAKHLEERAKAVELRFNKAYFQTLESLD